MGAKPNNKVIKGLLSEYDDCRFIVDGEIDDTTNTLRISRYFAKHYKVKKPYKNIMTKLYDNAVIYPSYYFCTPIPSEKSYSIHHFAGSWLEAYSKKIRFALGKYSLITIKKNREDPNASLPLKEGERIIFTIKYDEIRTIHIVKKYKNNL